MLKISVFIVLTMCLIYISKASLRVPRSHGFYRFFAWEFIIALILLNINVWFLNPFSLHQIISWFLLFVSIVPLAFGAHSLAVKGRLAKNRESEPQLLAFEKTTALVTTGIYHYIRHPLYSSLLILTWGVFFKKPSWFSLVAALAATAFLWATAKADEAECLSFFGPAYQAYKKKTRMFIPFII
jgi:protein-S-isoprenylcysteine O-methyltransferase Ste14